MPPRLDLLNVKQLDIPSSPKPTSNNNHNKHQQNQHILSKDIRGLPKKSGAGSWGSVDADVRRDLTTIGA